MVPLPVSVSLWSSLGERYFYSFFNFLQLLLQPSLKRNLFCGILVVLPRACSTFQQTVPPIWPDICVLAGKSVTMLPLTSRHLQRLGLGGSKTGLSINGTVSQSSWRASGQQPQMIRNNTGNSPCFPGSSLTETCVPMPKASPEAAASNPGSHTCLL